MKIISRAFKTLRILIIGWGFIVPLSYLFPLKKNLVLFIGKNNGLFFDNVKYLYLYLHGLKQNNVEYYFFTENKSVYDMLKQHNLPALADFFEGFFNRCKGNLFRRHPSDSRSAIRAQAACPSIPRRGL